MNHLNAIIGAIRYSARWGTPGVASAPAPAPPPPPPAGPLNTTLNLYHNVTATREFDFGHIFADGELAATDSIDVAGAIDVQVVFKNSYPSGCKRHAHVAGRAAITASDNGRGDNHPKTLTLTAAASSTGGPDKTTTNLRATGITAAFGGDFGTATFSNADFDSPEEAWIVGPKFGWWLFRKPSSTDAHVEFWMDVRLWDSGRVYVKQWVENNKVRQSGPTDKSGTYTFTLGGTQRFNGTVGVFQNHSRRPLLTNCLGYWLDGGTDAKVICRPDPAHWQATKLVGNYRTDITVLDSADGVVNQASTYSPGALLNYPANMGDGGYAPSIGPFPEHDIIWMLNSTPALVTGVLYNGLVPSRYSFHYRDETTHKPIVYTSYPETSLSGSASDGMVSVPSNTSDYLPTTSGPFSTLDQFWDQPHHPLPGYMAYLLTCDPFYLGELKFAVTATYLAAGAHRSGATGVIPIDGTTTNRGFDWCVRDLGYLAAIIPDDDPQATQFREQFRQNMDFYVNNYIYPTPSNGFGIFVQYSDYSTGETYFSASSWQNSWLSLVLGQIKLMNPTLPATGSSNLTKFFDYAAKWTVALFGAGGASEWPFTKAGEYFIPVITAKPITTWSPSAAWVANLGASHTLLYGTTAPTPVVGVDNLTGGNWPSSTSYFANNIASLAICAELGAAGAGTAWTRWTSAPNASAINANYALAPVWALYPRSVPGALTWLVGATANTWIRLTGSAHVNNPPSVNNDRAGAGPISRMDDSWCGYGYDQVNNCARGPATGGHGDSHQNSVPRAELNRSNPRWVEQFRADMITEFDSPDGTSRYHLGAVVGHPCSTHSYYNVVQSGNLLLRIGTGAVATSGGPSGRAREVVSFNTDSPDGVDGWSAPGYWPDVPDSAGAGDGSSVVVAGGNVLTFVVNAWVFKLNVSARTWGNASPGVYPPVSFLESAPAYDPVRDQVFLLGGGESTVCHTFKEGVGFTARTLTGAGAAAVMAQAKGHGLQYDSRNNKYLVRLQQAGATVYEIDPVTWVCTAVSTSGGTWISPILTTQASAPYQKWLWVNNIGGFCGILYIPGYDHDWAFLPRGVGV